MTPLSHPADRLVSALIADGLLTPDQEQRAQRVAAAALQETMPDDGLPRVAEVVAYLGGALVLAAGALFVGLNWGELGPVGQVIFLGIVTLVLAVAGLVVVRAGEQPLRRTRHRLAALLLVGSAVAAGFTVGRWADQIADGSSDVYWPGVAGAVTAGLLVVVLQRVLPSAFGLVALMVATLLALVFALASLDLGGELFAVAFWLVGVLWLTLVEAGTRTDHGVARPLGVTAALVGGQVGVVTPHSWIGYVLTALVALLGLSVYLIRPGWAYLAGAVIAVTLVVPEAVTDWTDGSLGVVGGVLLAGITLLIAALGGSQLRRRRQAQPPA